MLTMNSPCLSGHSDRACRAPVQGRSRRFAIGIAFFLLCVGGCSVAPHSQPKPSPKPQTSHTSTSSLDVAPSDIETVSPTEPAPITTTSDVKPSAPFAPTKPSIVEQPKAAAIAPPAPAKKVTPPAAKPVEIASAVKPKPAAPIAPVEPAPSAPSANNTLRGDVNLVAGTDQSVAASDMSDTVVYYVPNGGAPHPKPGRFRIYTRGKQFDPTTLVIPLGSTISFPNQDEILHNVFSVSPAANFDLGLYGEGTSADFTFKTPGLVLINCNVHRAMQANVLVVDTPYFTRPDKDGHFELTGLPAGGGKLMVWHPRATTQTAAVSVSDGVTVPVKLVLSKPRLAQHLNKENKAY
jgi:plastocyanin